MVDMSNNRSEVVDKSSTIKMTRKEKAFADYLINNPKASATQAVLHAYNIKNPATSTARSIANEIRTKPNVVRYLEQNTEQAENTILEVMEVSKKYAKEGGKEGASYASVAVSSANSLLDRVFGKATQKIVSENSNVNVVVTLK